VIQALPGRRSPRRSIRSAHVCADPVQEAGMSDIVNDLLKRSQEIANTKAVHAKWREDARLLEQAAKEIDGLRKQLRQMVLGE
jgi:hypothetical protein